MKKRKSKGMAMVMMVAVLLTLSFFLGWLKYWSDLNRSVLRENTIEFEVAQEADTIEYATRAIDTWFNLEGRSLLYPCEALLAGCDVGVLKNILPDHYASITTQEYKSINSTGLGYGASVVKEINPSGGWVYKIILYSNL